MTELKQFATDVMEMFAQQAEYFKTRNPEQLNRCKQIESKLKKRCKEILNPPARAEPSLFPVE